MPSSRSVVYAVAERHNGWFRAADAVEAGVARQQLARFAASGVLERSAHGIYRLRDFPATPFEDVVEACLWAGPDAVASHATALAIHGLGDAMPAVIHLTVPGRVRKRRAGVVLHRAYLPPSDVTQRDGVPVTTAARTIEDVAADGEAGADVLMLVDDAEHSGLVTHRRAEELRARLTIAT